MPRTIQVERAVRRGRTPLSVVVIACLSWGCCGVSDHQGEQKKAVVRQFLEQAMNTGEVERLPDIISPDYVEIYLNKVHKLGLAGAERHVLGVRTVFPDLRVTVDQQICQGDWVATRLTARGTQRGAWLGTAPTGRALELTGINLNRVVDGRIVEHIGAANLFAPLLEAGAIRVVGPQPVVPAQVDRD